MRDCFTDSWATQRNVPCKIRASSSDVNTGSGNVPSISANVFEPWNMGNSRHVLKKEYYKRCIWGSPDKALIMLETYSKWSRWTDGVAEVPQNGSRIRRMDWWRAGPVSGGPRLGLWVPLRHRRTSTRPIPAGPTQVYVFKLSCQNWMLLMSQLQATCWVPLATEKQASGLSASWFPQYMQ